MTIVKIFHRRGRGKQLEDNQFGYFTLSYRCFWVGLKIQKKYVCRGHLRLCIVIFLISDEVRATGFANVLDAACRKRMVRVDLQACSLSHQPENQVFPFIELGADKGQIWKRTGRMYTEPVALFDPSCILDFSSNVVK